MFLHRFFGRFQNLNFKESLDRVARRRKRRARELAIEIRLPWLLIPLAKALGPFAVLFQDEVLDLDRERCPQSMQEHVGYASRPGFWLAILQGPQIAPGVPPGEQLVSAAPV